MYYIKKLYGEKKNYIANPKLTQEVFGKIFKPVGLAAGFDKKCNND